jgi:predicted nucleic acid-binding protein
MGVNMLTIPITDFTRDVETWLDQAALDEITIEKDGKPYITLSKASQTKDFEDAVQYVAAETVFADYIITRNDKDFETAKIPVLSSDALINMIR